MQWLAQLCVRRPVMTTVFSLVILVVGGVFYFQLGVDQFPKIDFPTIIITTQLPGASPADIERDVSDKIEGAVNTIAGVDELRSNSSEGFSQVIIQFVLEKDVDVAANEVQQKINLVMADLPKDIDPPVVQKFDTDSAAILYIALNAQGATQKEITDYADRVVRRRIESVNGVGQVTLLGGRKRRINVNVDPQKLRSLGLSPIDVGAAINAQNITLPGGRVDASRDYISVRVLGRVERAEDLNRVIVKNSNGRSVRLEEIGNVEDGVEDLETAAQWNGNPTVVLAVRKQSGTNTVEVVDAVRKRLDDVRKILPKGYEITVQRDASEVIRTSTDAVKEHLVLGAIFAAIVVLLFLGNLRSTIIAALAIPTSIIGTFMLMKLKGYTFNTMSLLALALAVGIVIDDAIVVLENIFKHIEEHKKPPIQAAIDGTKEIGPAVLATTLSLMAVFVPIAFIAGVPGRFLATFGNTMVFAIGVSLFISFTLTPMLAARWLKPQDHTSGLTRLVDIFYRPIERWYMALLRFCMKRRWVVVLASLVAIGGCVPALMVARKGFIPIDDKAQFEVLVRLPEGRSLPATVLVGERVSKILRAMPEVTGTLLTVGDDAAQTPNLARIYVKLVPPDKRSMSQDQLKGVVREKILPTLDKNLKLLVADVNEFGNSQATARLQFLIAGPSLDAMIAANDRILQRMKKIPNAVDVDTQLVLGKPELGVVISRDIAADLGVRVMDVAQSLQFLVAGQKVSTFSENGESYDVWLRATGEYRSDEDSLRLLTVPSRSVGVVDLASVVTLVPGSSPTTIQRYGRERQVTYLANAAPGTNEKATGDAIRAILQDEADRMPSGTNVVAQGQSKLLGETAVSFGWGLLASLVFMYLILAAQFESWLHPFTIVVSLFLMLPFAIYSILLFDIALDMFSLLGIFVLFGVVKKNAILQIDHTNALREKGMPRDEAILQANRDRLRPILMTTFAFVAGMIPLVAARGIGSGFSHSTAGVVVGGQTLSLLLTLVGVPVLYAQLDELKDWVGVQFQKARHFAAQLLPGARR